MAFDVYACSESFRNDLLATIPALRNDPRYLRFVAYLLFGYSYDDDYNLMIPQNCLAAIEGKSKDLKDHCYCGKVFLEELREQILPCLHWGGWECDTYWHVRIIINDGLPESLHIRADEERLYLASGGQDLVDLVTGRPITARLRTNLREAQSKAAKARLPTTVCEAQRSFMMYMNDLPGNQFTSLLDYRDKAFEIIMNTKKSNANQTAAYQRAVLNVFIKFCTQPQPFYQPSHKGKGTRLFTSGSGLLQFPGPARFAVTSAAGWIDLDLASAHLAVAAKILQIPELHELLASGVNVWEKMADDLNMEFTDDFKAACKVACYSILYGAKQSHVQGQLTKALGSKVDSKKLLNHPIVTVLPKRGDMVAQQIVKDKGMEDCYGRKHEIAIDIDPIVEDKGMENCYGRKQKNATKITPMKQAYSILALCAQAYEMKLLTPALELTKDPGSKWHIMLFQHDGFTIAARDRNRTEDAVKKLQAAVNAEAEKLGIPTRLDVKKPKS